MGNSWGKYHNENSKKWGDLTKVDWHELTHDDRPLEVQYEDVDKEYKDEAKKLFVKEIGFEPKYDEQIMNNEISVRQFVRKFKLGQFTQEQLDRWFYMYGFITRKYIWERGGEEAHLIDPEEFKHGFKM